MELSNKDIYLILQEAIRHQFDLIEQETRYRLLPASFIRCALLPDDLHAFKVYLREKMDMVLVEKVNEREFNKYNELLIDGCKVHLFVPFDEKMTIWFRLTKLSKERGTPLLDGGFSGMVDSTWNFESKRFVETDPFAMNVLDK